MLSQIAKFPSFFYGWKIFHYIYICIKHIFLYAFTYWWTLRLLSCLGCCKLGYYINVSQTAFLYGLRSYVFYRKLKVFSIKFSFSCWYKLLPHPLFRHPFFIALNWTVKYQRVLEAQPFSFGQLQFLGSSFLYWNQVCLTIIGGLV